MANRACTAVSQGVLAGRIHKTKGTFSSRRSSSLAGKTTVAAAADNVRARWLKLGGGGSSEHYSSLAGSSGSALGTVGSSAVRAKVPACGRQPQLPPMYYSLRRVAIGIPRPGPSGDFDLVERGTYMPATQAGRLPMLPEVAAATWRELKRAQMAADDFETFI